MLLETERASCILRPWRETDAPDLIHHAHNRKVWINLTDLFPHPYGQAEAEQWFRIAAAPGPSLHLAIEFEGRAIGGIGVIAGEGTSRKTGQFGYWIGEAHWGHGLGTAAARALRSFLESDGRFARLEARVFAWNPASMRVLEKAGFIQEGVQRRSAFKDGCLIDSVVYVCFPPLQNPPMGEP